MDRMWNLTQPFSTSSYWFKMYKMLTQHIHFRLSCCDSKCANMVSNTNIFDGLLVIQNMQMWTSTQTFWTSLSWFKKWECRTQHRHFWRVCPDSKLANVSYNTAIMMRVVLIQNMWNVDHSTNIFRRALLIQKLSNVATNTNIFDEAVLIQNMWNVQLNTNIFGAAVVIQNVTILNIPPRFTLAVLNLGKRSYVSESESSHDSPRTHISLTRS